MHRPAAALAERERVRQEQEWRRLSVNPLRREGNATTPRIGIAETRLSAISNVIVFDCRLVRLVEEFRTCLESCKRIRESFSVARIFSLVAAAPLLVAVFLIGTIVLNGDIGQKTAKDIIGPLFFVLGPASLVPFIIACFRKKYWHRRLYIARMKLQFYCSIRSINPRRLPFASEIVLPTFSGSVIFRSAHFPHRSSEEEQAWLNFQLSVALGIIQNDQTLAFRYEDEDAMERVLRNNGIQFKKTLGRNARKRWIHFNFSSSSPPSLQQDEFKLAEPATDTNPTKKKGPRRLKNSKILYDRIPTENQNRSEEKDTDVECGAIPLTVASTTPTNFSSLALSLASNASSIRIDDDNNDSNNEVEDTKLASKPLERQETSKTIVESCSICLLQYKDGDCLVRLPCSHIFHSNCISKWCADNVRCPLCNLDLNKMPPPKTECSSTSNTTNMSSSFTLPNVDPATTTPTPTTLEVESIVDNNNTTNTSSSFTLSNVDLETATATLEVESIVDNNENV